MIANERRTRAVLHKSEASHLDGPTIGPDTLLIAKNSAQPRYSLIEKKSGNVTKC